MRLPAGYKAAKKMADQGALFVVNHSGGKDSQAMYAFLRDVLLVPQDQMVVVHAELPEMDWPGTCRFIRNNTSHELNVVRARKTFREMVIHRGKFPDQSCRQCTSDLKRGPIEVFIRALSKERGQLLVVNCMGLRADESTARSKKKPWKKNKSLSRAGRTVMDWLPIFRFNTPKVFETIHNAGQKAFWIYYKGMTRKSCVICVMQSKNDTCIAAQLMPGNAKHWLNMEKETGFWTKQGKVIREVLPELAEEVDNGISEGALEETATEAPGQVTETKPTQAFLRRPNRKPIDRQQRGQRILRKEVTHSNSKTPVYLPRGLSP